MVTQGLKDAVKAAVDFGLDTEQALGSSGLVAKVECYSNMVKDVTTLYPEVGTLKADLEQLQGADYIELAGDGVADAAPGSDKAKALCAAGVQLLQAIVAINSARKL